MINVIININSVTIRDTNMSSNVKEFAKEFVEIIIILLINFFSNYN